MILVDEIKEEFIKTCQEKVKRDGVESLLQWLDKSDFYIAPSSTRFHLNVEGGLLTHSLNVYHRLLDLNKVIHVCGKEETIAIVSLFHDVCKANCYKQTQRNVKENGVWVQKPYYEFSEKFCYGGHGAKSVFLIERFMRLTEEEAVCIHNHMGAYDRSPGDYSLNSAFQAYPLALLLHTADNIATCIDEKQV